ncbi:hypothetical protein N5C36_21290 [Shewanella xiamenensis]|nr:hypothetical protein [Shewanella xiamenensis]MDH1316614.1 hypothetical protein [Shewanella xiamenensis]
MSTKAMHTKTEPNYSIDQPINQWPQTAEEVLASAANITEMFHSSCNC